jgi:hypothetical protein
VINGGKESELGLVSPFSLLGFVIAVRAYQTPIKLFVGIVVTSAGIAYSFMNSPLIFGHGAIDVPAFPITFDVSLGLTLKPAHIVFSGENAFKKLGKVEDSQALSPASY